MMGLAQSQQLPQQGAAPPAPYHVTQSMELLAVLRAEQCQVADPAERIRRAGDIARLEFKLSQSGYRF